MRKDRMEEESLLVNGPVGGEVLTKQERQTLREEVGELTQRMEQAKEQEIAE
ncbi:hypothetical protein LOK74_07220 [Brevibacillus humidisoli]|uniref:hypothetical protein n=1 Tax=Brevibacillus humidisoli TaxID=2895522 RepID=UPI001E2C6517|nr:hypothetical protein [Brevibacillus humidisoli]UFJ42275.1 hypothetical protein LOK74_07220 [Brevibacillus humidisoli]